MWLKLNSGIRAISLIGDIVGCALLAIFVFSFSYLAAELQFIRLTMELEVGLSVVLFVAGVAIWHLREARPKQWLVQALISVLVGVAWLLVDIAFADHRGSSELETLTASRSFFLTLLVCPCYTAIALAGLVRSWIIICKGHRAGT
jgi:hypothetical protein